MHRLSAPLLPRSEWPTRGNRTACLIATRRTAILVLALAAAALLAVWKHTPLIFTASSSNSSGRSDGSSSGSSGHSSGGGSSGGGSSSGGSSRGGIGGGVTGGADQLLIFGRGGAFWANGTQALVTSGTVTWAVLIGSGSALLPAGGLALAEEDTASIIGWHPAAPQRLQVTLSQLRAPVAIHARKGILYVACFGEEGVPGRSGVALIDAERWQVIREVAVGTHVHNVYPANAAGGGGRGFGDAALLLTDVGDPWVSPAQPGGLWLLDEAATRLPRRISPPMHARAVTPLRVDEHGVARLHVITQEPLGDPTRVVTLAGDDWHGQPAAMREVASTLLRAAHPTKPSDGGADIFEGGEGGTLLCTDRCAPRPPYAHAHAPCAHGALRSRLHLPPPLPPGRYLGPGRLFALDAANLTKRREVELGVHPRFTTPETLPYLGGAVLLSVSRGDGLLTTLDATTLQVVARQPAYIPEPSFVLRYMS